MTRGQAAIRKGHRRCASCLRYVLMGLAAYGILAVSPASLYGLLAGLFLPVAAIACEAAYEAYVALARCL